MLPFRPHLFVHFLGARELAVNKKRHESHSFQEERPKTRLVKAIYSMLEEECSGKNELKMTNREQGGCRVFPF